MINWYEALKAQNRIPVDDRLAQLFGATTQGPAWKTITGVLPLTFTAKGGTAVDWTISGNDDVGENLFDKSIATAGYRIAGDGAPDPDPRCTLSDYIEVSASTAYAINTNISYDDALAQYDANKTFIERTVSGSGNFTTSATTKYVRISMLNGNVNTKMLVKGSTAPDHYIPYQQGVGERTANLFDKDDVETGAYDSQTGEKIDAPALKRTANPITVDGGTVYRISNEGGSIRAFEYQNDGTYIGASLVNTTFTTSANTGKINLHGISTYFTEKMMFTKGSTAPSTYVPYGYEIPISVNDTPQTFYIGSTPLTEGQSISKTSTGVDIELFDGENTVSTTLYNKPQMEIKYR